MLCGYVVSCIFADILSDLSRSQVISCEFFSRKFHLFVRCYFACCF